MDGTLDSPPDYGSYSFGDQLEHTQGIEIAGQRCLILAFDGELAPPLPTQVVRCPSGYQVAGGFRLGTQAFVLLCQSADADGDARSAPPTHLAELLTQRELQIAILVSQGKVNKQIAYQLRISEYTVSTHLRRIFCKLGVSSRAAMVAQLMAQIVTEATPSVASRPRRPRRPVERTGSATMVRFGTKTRVLATEAGERP